MKRPGLHLGAWVVCERSTPARGTWRRYAGRVGRIVTVNRGADEVGVRFTASAQESTSWFRPDELALAHAAEIAGRPAIATNAERSASWRAERLPGMEGSSAHVGAWRP